jgi:hypothetical protein
MGMLEGEKSKPVNMSETITMKVTMKRKVKRY